MTAARSLLILITLTLAPIIALPAPARAYQIDCAILLCLAGGFPPSTPCAAARAEMIRRITPWPIEPPLQIWRCPMRAGLRLENRPSENAPTSIAFATQPLRLRQNVPDPSTRRHRPARTRHAPARRAEGQESARRSIPACSQSTCPTPLSTLT